VGNDHKRPFLVCGRCPGAGLRQSEGQVEDEGPFVVLAGRDAFQHLDRDAALEQVAR
jgi:hypothetical protein